MNESGDSATTVVIRRFTEERTDDHGDTIWTAEVEEIELELMSTQDLELAIQASSEIDRESLRALAESDRDGVVARDRATGLYDVISEAELRESLDTDVALSTSIRRNEMVPESTDAGSEDELSLVSTQALHRMLNHDDSEDSSEVPDDKLGFNPYDKK